MIVRQWILVYAVSSSIGCGTRTSQLHEADIPSRKEKAWRSHAEWKKLHCRNSPNWEQFLRGIRHQSCTGELTF